MCMLRTAQVVPDNCPQVILACVNRPESTAVDIMSGHLIASHLQRFPDSLAPLTCMHACACMMLTMSSCSCLGV